MWFFIVNMWTKYFQPGSSSVFVDCTRTDGSHYIYVTWALRYLKSPANRLFIKEMLPADIKENINAPHHWSFMTAIPDNPLETPLQRASESESASMSWRHQVATIYLRGPYIFAFKLAPYPCSSRRFRPTSRIIGFQHQKEWYKYADCFE